MNYYKQCKYKTQDIRMLINVFFASAEPENRTHCGIFGSVFAASSAFGKILAAAWLLDDDATTLALADDGNSTTLPLADDASMMYTQDFCLILINDNHNPFQTFTTVVRSK